MVTGPETSIYAGGEKERKEISSFQPVDNPNPFIGKYHGRLVFPAEFPFKPPSIYMTTPNGRFKTETRLCLSISDYHPDTWNPACELGGKSLRIRLVNLYPTGSVATILTGLLSFMLEKSPTLGSIETSDYDKRQLATRSHEFNLRNKTFCELFPDIADESKAFIERMARGTGEPSETEITQHDLLDLSFTPKKPSKLRQSQNY